MCIFNLRAGKFYIQLASEPDRRRVLQIIREQSGPISKSSYA
jgi:5-methyltetrahydropteroyltriglutamate--homocysteine methyltransferase